MLVHRATAPLGIVERIEKHGLENSIGWLGEVCLDNS